MEPTTSPLANGRRVLLSALAAAVRPRAALTVSQWADAHRRLSQKASAEFGMWRTARTPYLREIMDCLSAQSPVEEVWIMKSAQVGGTEVGLNWIGYVMHHCPAPMLVVLPTLEVRRRWSLQRLEPMLKETPELRSIFDALRTRSSTNGQDIKDYPGGMLVLGGANSAASLASMPIRYSLCDEVDKFKWELKGEGDPLGLIDERQKSFRRRKKLRISTPTVKGASRIEEGWEKSDQRHYTMPCPECREGIYFKWPQLQWNADLSSIRYACEHCGALIEERHKAAMLAAGEWVPANPDSKIRGYHLNALMAPPGLGPTWRELVTDFLDASKDPVKLKRFINSNLGETWEDRSRDLRPNVLAQRAEPYKLREIPPGCLLLTAGVDTQDDRLAVQINGWGEGEKCWVVDWLEIPGHPGREELWNRLTAYLNTPLQNAWGRQMRIEATAIDSGGHFTHEVYAYVRAAAVPRLMACKGANVPGKPILSGRPVAQDINLHGRIIRKGVKLWTIGSDTAKHTLHNRLFADQGADAENLRVHFSHELPADYYDQILSEVFDPERNRWIKRRGRRNEGLDTFVLSIAASQHPEIRVHARRASDWANLRKLLEPQTESERALIPETQQKPVLPGSNIRSRTGSGGSEFSW